jgi:hypothetical protein
LLSQLRQIGNPWIGDETELRQMRSQSIGQHGALANKQRPGPMSHENALLLDSLYGHEPHHRALHRFANRLGV